MILALDASVVAFISLLISFMADRTEVMLIIVVGMVATRMALWVFLTRNGRPHSLTTETAFFVICLALGAFNDWNTVVRHRVYDYTVPSDLLPWSSIPSWMLIYWGMILRFMATVGESRWFNAPGRETLRYAQGDITGRHSEAKPKNLTCHGVFKWKVPLELALVFSTRQSIYRFHEDPLLSWLPFAASLSLYLIVFPPTRGEWRFVGLLAPGGPLIESLYIQVGHLHHYPLGWIGGVPVWIALWWILAGLIWKDLSPRLLVLITRASGGRRSLTTWQDTLSIPNTHSMKEALRHPT